MPRLLLLLFVAGGVGTLVRFGLARLVQPTPERFPWGTLTVNAVGCVLCGVTWGVLEARELLGTELRVVLLAGFFGALTTFSTYSLETVLLAADVSWKRALANVLASNVIGIGGLLAGLAATRFLARA